MAITNPTLDHIDEVMHSCIHCGMCLPVCPTYALTQQEQSSPRGRIRLMRSLHDGSLSLSEQFVDEMYFCLDCQACQTACPAGVHYGTLVEDARNIIAERKMEPLMLRVMKRMFLRGVLSSSSRTKLWAKVIQFYQRIGLRDAVEESNIIDLFSHRLAAKHQLLPNPNEYFFDDLAPEFIQGCGGYRGRVGFLSGCIMNVAFANVHQDAVEVLTANGFDVVIPKTQGCCGSLHGHNGDKQVAKALARNIINVFDKLEINALVIDSAGCGAFIKEYGTLFADDPEYAERAKTLSNKAKDITEFLFEVGVRPPRQPLHYRVTYHEACHLVHTQKISHQPRNLIAAIPGIIFVELPEATWCCGSAGMYNIVRFDDSMSMLDRKMTNLASTKADIALTANPGCHLQLQFGIKKLGLTMEVLHPVSLLNRAYQNKISQE